YLFESGDLGALSHDGEPVWSRALKADYGEIRGYGLGSSLAGNDEALFVLVAHDGPSYLLAVDPATGKTLWKADRPARSAWTTPIVVPGGGGELVVVSIDGAVEAYDAETGERVWWIDDVSGNRLSSPVVLAGGRLVVPSVDSRSTLAVPIEHRGPLAGDKVLWRGRGATAGMSSPVVTGGAVCLINSLGVIRCLEQRSGQSRWAARLPSPAWATSIVNGDRVYVFGVDGTATILAADVAEPIELARNSLTVPDRVYGVAAVDGALLVRTGRELIRIGRGGGTGE
ncbi:MAG: PQQ-binding-like beta-propeller repeat protein, partial [Acidobacteria bacterium]|nr:PQQ-binding-like beta-propeller repeat protein [Acidobacteriota bacterium]